jgi:hypothetical protein
MMYKCFLSAFIPTAMKIFMQNSMWQIKNHKKIKYEKGILINVPPFTSWRGKSTAGKDQKY